MAMHDDAHQQYRDALINAIRDRPGTLSGAAGNERKR
jgi:hypothetical protein